MKTTDDLVIESGMLDGTTPARIALNRFRDLVRDEALEEAATAIDSAETYIYEDPGEDFARIVRALKKDLRGGR